MSGFSGPFIALIIYAFIAYRCVYKNDFLAGLFGGLLGFCIHILELIFYDLTSLGTVELIFFLINVIFPVILAYVSYRVMKK
jgi:hypothetical protein